jgi:predicted transcriptional regulator
MKRGNMKQKFIFVILIVSLLGLAILAEFSYADSPPTLPILIHGKVYSSSGKPAEGKSVSAYWADENGKILSASAKTLTGQEASILGSPELAGEYRFAEGQIYAAEGSVISLSSSGVNVSVVAVSGTIISAPDIIIGGVVSSIMRDIGNFLARLIGIKPANSTLMNLTGNYPKSKKPGDEEYGQGMNNSSDENENGMRTGEGNGTGEGGIGNYDGNQTSDYGNSSIIGNTSGVNATKIKEDEDENYTWELSESMGNYTSSGVVGINLSREEKVTRESFAMNYGEEAKIIFTEMTKSIADNVREHFNFILASLGIILLLFIVSIIIRYRKEISTYFTRIGSLERKVSGVLNLGVSQFMNTKVVKLDSGDSVLEAIEIFNENTISTIAVQRGGKIAGLLTKYDVISKLYQKKFDEIKKTTVGEIMKKKFSMCKSNTAFGDLYFIMLKNNLTEMVIGDGGKIEGSIDHFDILNMFENAAFEIENPPMISEAMSKDYVAVTGETNLRKLTEKLLINNSEYALVLEKDKPVGIVTFKDLLSAMSRSLDFDKSRAVNIMSSTLVSMTPGTSIYVAFKLMLSRKFNQIPIMAGDKIEGVVNIRYIIKMYYDLISELKRK